MQVAATRRWSLRLDQPDSSARHESLHLRIVEPVGRNRTRSAGGVVPFERDRRVVDRDDPVSAEPRVLPLEHAPLSQPRPSSDSHRLPGAYMAREGDLDSPLVPRSICFVDSIGSLDVSPEADERSCHSATMIAVPNRDRLSVPTGRRPATRCRVRRPPRRLPTTSSARTRRRVRRSVRRATSHRRRPPPRTTASSEG